MAEIREVLVRQEGRSALHMIVRFEMRSGDMQVVALQFTNQDGSDVTLLDYADAYDLLPVLHAEMQVRDK